eukprot:7809103-Alexandrium_andersonii.AAC.1
MLSRQPPLSIAFGLRASINETLTAMNTSNSIVGMSQLTLTCALLQHCIAIGGRRYAWRRTGWQRSRRDSFLYVSGWRVPRYCVTLAIFGRLR